MDQWTKRAVVILLGFLAVIGLSGGVVLAYAERGIPDFLISSTSTSIGALAGALVMQKGKEEG